MTSLLPSNMHGLWNFFLERRAFTVFVMVALTIASVYAIITMPKEAAPDVSIPSAIVSVVLPGATATDVERLVVDKMEPTLRNVANVHKVSSTASQGLAVMTVAFNQNVDLNVAVQDVRNAVDRTKGDLPSDATDPTVTKIETSDQPIFIVSISSPLAPESLTALGKELEDELSSIDGVSKVDVAGVRQREISIVINNNALEQFKLSIGQIIQALRGTNASAPAGIITTDNIRYPVQFKGDLTDVADIAEVPIVSAGGKFVVGDVAQVVNGFEEPTTISHLYTKGEEVTYALTLNIYKSKGGSILNVSDKIKERLEELKTSTLKGSNVAVTYDAAKEVRTNIEDLTNAGRDTVVLVMLILFVSIGFLESVVSALSIPFSFMIAFIGMWMTGNTINFLSLFSLIIAIGILVDSGIVVVEAIHTNREKGMDKVDAAKEAIRQYAWPLIAGTMTTVAVFFPLFFLSGIIGDYMKTIPFTVIVVLLASIVVALGFVPLIALALLRHEESKFAARREQLWHDISTTYRSYLERLFGSVWLQRAFFGFLAASFVFAMALPITGLLKVSMFPPTDTERYYISIELPQAATLSDTAAAVKQVEDVLVKDPNIDSFTATIGAPSVFTSWSGGSNNTRLANLTVNLAEDRKQTSIELAQAARVMLSKLPLNATISVMEDAGGPPSGAPVVVKVWSDDTVTLAQATDQVQRIIEQNPNTRDVTSSLDSDSTQLSISVDRDRANEYGLSVTDLASTLQAAVAGVKATTVRIGTDDIDVRVKLNLNKQYVDPADTTNTNADAIANIPVVTSRGVVPLGSLVTIGAERSATQISHEDGSRLGTVQANVKDGQNAVETTRQIQKAIDAAKLPAGVRVTYGGDTEDVNKTFTEMIAALIAGVALMFAILVLEFNAFRTSGRLLLAIPLSLTGVLIGLWITGQPVSITAMLGIIALGGVLINHGILLLDVMNNLRKLEGAEPVEIVLDAATTRIRPILLTTITTVIGMIPLIFVSGMWAPLAYTISFGLLYGTLLTLVLIPLLSYRYEVKQHKKRAKQ